MSTDPTVERALAYASCGWPVFPCQPGSKQPATRHGFLDATTDPDHIRWWWRRDPGANLAIATGTPGPDVLDVDQHGDAGSGYPALNKLARAGLTRDAGAVVATPHGGLHLYYAGTDQGCGKLPAHHLDHRSRGGYVLAPPSRVDGRAYRVVRHQPRAGAFEWDAAVRLLDPQRETGSRPALREPGGDLSHLAGWVARLTEGNRNDGLFWAACRAAEAGDDTTLGQLAEAARQAGLGGREITATISSARRTTARQPQPQEREPGRPAGPAGTERCPADGQRGWEGIMTRALRTASQNQQRVDANATMWRLRSLAAMGHDATRIGRALGTHPVYVHRVLHGHARTIPIGFRDDVIAVWDAWWDKTPPADSPARRRAAARARHLAEVNDWPAAAGLDEDQLDQPGYRPWCRYRPATGTGTAPAITPATLRTARPTARDIA